LAEELGGGRKRMSRSSGRKAASTAVARIALTDGPQSRRSIPPNTRYPVKHPIRISIVLFITVFKGPLQKEKQAVNAAYPDAVSIRHRAEYVYNFSVTVVHLGNFRKQLIDFLLKN
jgi:hypothetical protein